jgi:hypothetical protein
MSFVVQAWISVCFFGAPVITVFFVAGPIRAPYRIICKLLELRTRRRIAYADDDTPL